MNWLGMGWGDGNGRGSGLVFMFASEGDEGWEWEVCTGCEVNAAAARVRYVRSCSGPAGQISLVGRCIGLW